MLEADPRIYNQLIATQRTRIDAGQVKAINAVVCPAGLSSQPFFSVRDINLTDFTIDLPSRPELRGVRLREQSLQVSSVDREYVARHIRLFLQFAQRQIAAAIAASGASFPEAAEFIVEERLPCADALSLAADTPTDHRDIFLITDLEGFDCQHALALPLPRLLPHLSMLVLETKHCTDPELEELSRLLWQARQHEAWALWALDGNNHVAVPTLHKNATMKAHRIDM